MSDFDNDTRFKFNEAQYFYEQMCSTTENSDKFCHNLSAFLSAARSVTLFLKKELEDNHCSLDYYENELKNVTQPFSKFNTLRVTVIHRGKVELKYILKLSETRLKNGGIMTAKVEASRLDDFTKSHLDIWSEGLKKLGNIKTIWMFGDPLDGMLVLEVAKKYLDELLKIVDNCQKIGKIGPYRVTQK